MSADDYSKIYADAGQQYGVDPELLKAQGKIESSFNPNAIGPDTPYGNAKGIAQIIPSTAKSLGVNNPSNPKEAIFAQAKLMAENLKRYKDPEAAVSAYHGGTDKSNWGPKTKDYTQKVMHEYKGNSMADIDPDEQLLQDHADQRSAAPYDDSSDPDEQLIEEHSLQKKLEDAAAPKAALDNNKVASSESSKNSGIHGFIDEIGKWTDRLGANPLIAAKEIPDAIGAHMTPLGVATLMPQIVAGPILGNVSRLVGGAEMLGRAAPAIERGLNFLSGNVESNAVRNMAGEKILPSTIGNKLEQLGSSSASNALQGGAFEASNGGDFTQGAETGAWAGPAGLTVAKMFQKAFGIAPKQADPYINKLIQAFQRDGVSPQEAANRLQGMGENATLADIGGANVRGMAGAVAQTPGPAMDIAEQALENRSAGQVDRLTNKALGGLEVDPAATYEGTIKKLDDARQANAAPLYKKAFAGNQSVQSPIIDRILETDAGKKALEFARGRMNNRMARMGIPDPELTEQMRLTQQYQPGGATSGLKLQTHDFIKQGFDDQYKALMRKGEEGAASDILDLKKDYVKELDKVDQGTTGGKYKQARAAYSGPSQSKESIDSGYDFAKNGGIGNREIIDSLSEHDKPFFRIGVANWIRDTLNNTPDGANAARRLFNTPNKRAALESVFPSKSAFDDFAKEVENESKFARTKYEVLGNSRTASRQEALADLGQNNLTKTSKAVGNIAKHGAELLTRTPTGQAIYIGKNALNMVTAPRPISEEFSRNLGNALFTPDGGNAAVTAMTPATQGAFPRKVIGRQNILTGYINMLMDANNLKPEPLSTQSLPPGSAPSVGNGL